MPWIYDVIIDDLLEDKADYIKKGYIYFDKIEFTDKEVILYQGPKRLASYRTGHSVDLKAGDTYTFILEEGRMKIGITQDIK